MKNDPIHLIPVIHGDSHHLNGELQQVSLYVLQATKIIFILTPQLLHKVD